MLCELLGQSYIKHNLFYLFDICSALNCYPAVIFHVLNVKRNILFTWKKKCYIKKYVLVLEFYVTIITNNYSFMVLIK